MAGADSRRILILPVSPQDKWGGGQRRQALVGGGSARDCPSVTQPTAARHLPICADAKTGRIGRLLVRLDDRREVEPVVARAREILVQACRARAERQPPAPALEDVRVRGAHVGGGRRAARAARAPDALQRDAGRRGQGQPGRGGRAGGRRQAHDAQKHRRHAVEPREGEQDRGGHEAAAGPGQAVRQAGADAEAAGAVQELEADVHHRRTDPAGADHYFVERGRVQRQRRRQKPAGEAAARAAGELNEIFLG